MVQFTREVINKKDIANEKKIITAMVVSDSFLLQTNGTINPDYFSSSFAKIIGLWCLDYFDKYKKAPQQHIQDIYNEEYLEYSEPDQKNIEEFLTEISDDYERDYFNVQYAIDAKINLFTKRQTEQMLKEANILFKQGNYKEVSMIFRKSEIIQQENSKFFNPFDKDEINSHDVDRKDNILFKMNGRTGDYFGPFERSWVISFQAPEKTGKSFVLKEVLFQALENGLKVVLFSLEMNKSTMKNRIYQRLTSMANEDIKNHLVAVMDCHNNQDDSCTEKERVCRKGVVEDDGTKMLFEDAEEDYIPCTECRGKNNNMFIPAVWKKRIDIKKMTKAEIKKARDIFVKLYTDNLRVKTYPRFSATMEDIDSDMIYLREVEGFNDDVVFVDYIDILLSENKNLSERGQVDAIWKKFAAMAAKENNLWVTVEQSNKLSNYKESLDVGDVTDDKRKNAHVDAKYGLNVTPIEKSEGVMRINTLLHRHRDYDEFRQLLCLRILAISNCIIDSEIIHVKKNNN